MGKALTAVRVKVPATSANLGPGFDCLVYNYIGRGKTLSIIIIT